jgi:hypothetical protein
MITSHQDRLLVPKAVSSVMGVVVEHRARTATVMGGKLGVSG